MFGCTPLRFALALSKVLLVRHDVIIVKRTYKCQRYYYSYVETISEDRRCGAAISISIELRSCINHGQCLANAQLWYHIQ